MNKYLFLLFFLIQFMILQGQDNKESLDDITQKFRDFEYKEVIENANIFLTEKKNFSNPELIEIFRMKGISHYALLDDSEARLSFIEILRIDSSYALDPSFTSPKIITFFSDVKNEYIKSIAGKEEKIYITQYDTVYVPVVHRDTIAEYSFKNAIIRSIIIPGTGHLYLTSNLKSWLLTFLSVASVGTGIYYIVDTNEKERIYLHETDRNLVVEKYNNYNFSYRMRNLAFISFAAIWLYSQLDLLFFIENDQPGIFSYLPKVFINSEGILLNYRWQF